MKELMKVRSMLFLDNLLSSMKLRYLIWALICLAASCSYPEVTRPDKNGAEDEYQSLVLVIPQSGFEDSEPETRNEAIIGSDVEFVWSVTDSVGIFPDAGSQIFFSMASGAGQVSAAFDGGGWALKKSSAYFSYFPFTADFYINITLYGAIFKGFLYRTPTVRGADCSYFANSQSFAAPF